jgi:hypothetical protein
VVAETVQNAASTGTSQANSVTNVAINAVRDLTDSVRQQGSPLTVPAVQQQMVKPDPGSQTIVQSLVAGLTNQIRRRPLTTLGFSLFAGALLQDLLSSETSTTTPMSTASHPSSVPTYSTSTDNVAAKITTTVVDTALSAAATADVASSTVSDVTDVAAERSAGSLRLDIEYDDDVALPIYGNRPPGEVIIDPLHEDLLPGGIIIDPPDDTSDQP